MKGLNLGEFEEIVILAVAILDDKAYGYAISREIQHQTGRIVSLGAVHSALHRLEKKGFLQSHLAGATTKRGGKRRRFFLLTNYGKKAVEEKRRVRENMWLSIPKVVWAR
ncbi:helix-turn-helix transcriptional regulator [Fulvivirgaceae bacterium BMA12]|uniref:Helix-turn-helix transcriptional regulator n=1 Tax=Agaribacillus aureus TaxID=3051825 RepID=A0ABT8KYL7_9BACT|nr:helix-turn-helix transcriptional regulator [Fulvivirgaceae bacterium BMA12]